MKNEKEILKWLNGELSSEEIEDLKQSEDSKTLEKIAHYASQLEAPKVDAQATFEAFKTKNQSKNKSKVRTLNVKAFYRMAAVFVVLLTSAYFIYFNTSTSFETQIAQTKTVLLPDHSEVILNATSKLSFNERKWDDKRDLTLDGEAYFKVQKGKTFSVNTNSGIVKVLGTQFNVKERKNYFEVHCYEGLVSVTYSNKTIKLPPGKTFRVINGTIENVDDFNSKRPSWIEQESSFNRIPLDQVIAELERQYDLNIKDDGVDTSKLFTGSFTNTNKDIALQAVTIPLQLSYRIQGKTVILYNYEVK
ncbi:FecR family protein [Flavobacterium cellulosilyticum]|uniref:FecR family protein n=1 Tax=Flavobacterium cellulosilyticum TaxID=2541731 RepID=A0A4R5CHF7_9FLAO|nr:FecR domain-containing protein [Flavobacterium cellulosilyticum]TDD97950.1 FecR family protein [Flavobacterium cellulosilyticum]